MLERCVAVVVVGMGRIRAAQRRDLNVWMRAVLRLLGSEVWQLEPVENNLHKDLPLFWRCVLSKKIVRQYFLVCRSLPALGAW